MASISIALVITIFIALLGLYLAKEMIEPIVKMAIDAKRIVGGDLEHSVEVSREDEIGDLGRSLNLMAERIRDNISELKNYGEKTKEINIDINKKVMALSGLLQIGSLISGGGDLKIILDLLADKISCLEDSNPTIIMLANEETNTLDPISILNFKSPEILKRPVLLGHGLIGRAALEVSDIIIDANTEEITPEIEELRKVYEVKNAIIIPFVVHKKCSGIMLTGNNSNAYIYNKDDIELLRVFTKQATIAVENDTLIKKAGELEVADELTGLYNASYIKERLEEEIKRSMIYQRPCSFILLKIEAFDAYCNERGRMAGEAALKRIAKLISSNLTPVDKAARFADEEFVIVLPERNKREASAICKEITKNIEELVIDPKAEKKWRNLKISTGISENPIDGAAGVELILEARNRLKESIVQSKKQA